MPIFKFIIIFLVFILFSCNRESENNLSQGEADTLTAFLKKEIAGKRELKKLQDKFSTSASFRSILKYKPIIKKYSKRYGFDWRLIAAQIMQESRFREEARSRVGARGLMQIMPQTAKELSAELDILYILKNPRENIAAGIYHMKKQYGYFPKADYTNRLKLSLAAYNAGPGRVFDSQDIARYKKKSPYKWNNIRASISKLKSDDWQLHLQVWPQGKPRYGYFYGYEETISYVDNIWEMYKVYKKLL